MSGNTLYTKQLFHYHELMQTQNIANLKYKVWNILFYRRKDRVTGIVQDKWLVEIQINNKRESNILIEYWLN